MAISSPPRRGGQAAPHGQRGLITTLVVAVVAALVLGTAVAALLVRGGSSSSGVQGSGVAATQSRALPTFSGLDLAGSNNVTVVVGGRQSVVVHADSNLVGYVTTRVVAGTLVIGTTGSFTARSPMSVEVSVPSLVAVRLSGSGEISVNRIDASRLTVALPGSGALYAGGIVDSPRRHSRRLRPSAARQPGRPRRACGRRWLRPHPRDCHRKPERGGIRQRRGHL